ncbi:hypothetical protein [uncultured Dialister sp.]|uniref:hypothetical protein n=1 Tax=Dialister succinatiphilus TaxID=487173 RepID=UPI00266FF6A5|nr:hypothetical protein [uncultured Dialister sp.]
MIKLDMEDINRKAKMDVMNEVLRLRLSTLLKDEFHKACETNGTQAASVIRELMAEYVKRTKENS